MLSSQPREYPCDLLGEATIKQKYILAIFSLLAATAFTAAIAATSTENDALAIDAAKISMTQAVNVAEQHVGGKATRVEFERHKGLSVFDIEVVKGKKVMDVKVDSMNGKVISVTEDIADRDDEQEEAD